VTPEESGLCGCWQFIAVWRERQKLRKGKVVEASQEYSFYTSSLVLDENNAQEVAQFIRGHWGACENGSHYRRDVTLGEDASLVSGRNAAQAMATLRNLVLGLFELQKERGKTSAKHVPSWQRRMSATHAIQLITKGG
jgi:predicted transposase YbfD/YdcC